MGIQDVVYHYGDTVLSGVIESLLTSTPTSPSGRHESHILMHDHDEELKLLTQSDIVDLLEMRDVYKRSQWLGRFFFKVGMGILAVAAMLAQFKTHILTLLRGN